MTDTIIPFEALCLRSARVGFISWILILIGVVVPGHLPLLHGLFILAPLVVVPICLSRTAERIGAPLQNVFKPLLPFAMTLLTLSFFFQSGHFAFALASPWLLFTLLLFLQGTRNFLSHGISPLNETAFDFAFIYLVIGGVWVGASRAGVSFLGFGEPTVLLTAIHFHFAGFATLVVAGLIAYLNKGQRFQSWYLGAITGLVVGMPLVAVGISTNRPMETAAGIFFAVAATSYAIFQLRISLASPHPGMAKAGLIIASMCLIVGMVLAALYASGRSFFKLA